MKNKTSLVPSASRESHRGPVNELIPGQKRFSHFKIIAFALLAAMHGGAARAAEVVIDNDGTGGASGYLEAGTWTTSSSGGGYGLNSRYAVAGTGSITARWTPNIPAAASYDVYVWYLAAANRATNAPFFIQYNGGSTTYLVNQTTSGSRWLKLGTHSFAAGTAGYVSLTNNANAIVGADAVAFVTAGAPAPKSTDAMIMPRHKVEQVLFDADPSGVKKYLAFPTIQKNSGTSIVVSYKRGDQHASDANAPLETMIFNPTTKTVVSRVTTDQTPSVVNQNPEITPMPNGDIFNYVDRQSGGSTTRLGMRAFRSTDLGVNFVDQGNFPQVGAYQYGYAFDNYNDAGTVYLLAMSFTNLIGATQAVHVIKSSNSGVTWSYVKNLTSTFSYSMNESSLEKYGTGFLVVARGYDSRTKLFKTDSAFALVAQKDLAASYPFIQAIARPQLFVENGTYYLLCRNTAPGSHLQLYQLNPATLELETSVVLDTNAFNLGDSYYGEYYLQVDSGTTYFNVINYKKGGSSDQPNIVRLEYKWDELRGKLVENFNAMTSGAAPTGWTAGTAGGTVTVESFPSAADRSLRLVDTSSGALVEAYKNFGSTIDEVTAEIKVLLPQTNGTFGVSLRDASGNAATTVGFDELGQLYTYNGATKTVLQSYTANTWYSIRMVGRSSTDKVDVYVNGVLAAGNFGFRTVVANLADLRVNSTTPFLGTAYFDDVIVY